MPAIFNRVFGAKAPVQEATVIDQQAYFDLLERRQKRWLDDIREREADRNRIAVIVWTWARDCVNFDDHSGRCRRKACRAKSSRGCSVWLRAR